MPKQQNNATLTGIVDVRPRKDQSLVVPNTTTKRWASEKPLTGLESAKEQEAYITPSAMLAQPTVMHFGGYELNKKQSQVLRVVNKSTDSIRMTLLKPTTPFFQLVWKKEKPGFLAPGMALEVVVDFAPTEWRYYYDCIRINCGEEKILIPIHAYPVMNKAVFPTRFDVGKERLGSTKTRAIKLKCTAPIAFEFEISFTKEHYDFSVSPLRGVVPANGEVPIVVKYTPTKLSTSECKIELNIAQFNYKPFETTIVGSGVTDFISDIGEDDDQPEAFGSTNNRREKAKATGLPLPPKNPGAGAILDAGADYAATMNREQARRSLRKATRKEQKSEYFAETDGIRIPHQLGSGHHMVNFVLTQEKGKLKPKDLKKAIEKQRAIRQAQVEAVRAAKSALKPGADGGGESLKSTRKKTKKGQDSPDLPTARDRGPGSGPSLPHTTLLAEAEARGRQTQPKQIRDAAFIQEMNEIEVEERQREFKSAPVIGEPLMEDEEIRAVEQAREKRQIEIEIEGRDVDRARTETEALGPYQEQPARCTVPHAEVPKVLAHPAFAPQFNQYVNDTWSMRGRVVKKLVGSVTKFIVRRRVADRLAALKSRLGVDAGGSITKAAVAALVEKDQRSQAAQSSGPNTEANNADSAGAANKDGNEVVISAEEAAAKAREAAALAAIRNAPVKLQFEKFYERFSQYDPDSTTSGIPMKPAALPTYHNLDYLALVVPNEYELAGYTEDPLPPFPSYVPSEEGREMHVGAIEEESFCPHKTVEELDQSEQAQLARVQHKRYVEDKEREQALQIFSKYDADGSGTIDSREMEDVLRDLGVDLADDDPVLRSVMESADVDDDGHISFPEFLVFFRDCLAALSDAAAKAGDARKRLDITFFHSTLSQAQAASLPVHLTERLRAHPAYEALPPVDSLEFHPTYDLRPKPLPPTGELSRAARNEQAQVLADAEHGFISMRYQSERAHFEALPAFFQSPADCLGNNEFVATADLVPWRAERSRWQLATPGGLTVGVGGTAFDSLPAAQVLRPELFATAEKELRGRFEGPSAETTWAGVRPQDLLLTEGQSDDDLSDSDTDSDDECGLPLRPGSDVLLTPAFARHFGEHVGFDALYARELSQMREEFDFKTTEAQKRGAANTPAQEDFAAAVEARTASLDEEIARAGSESTAEAVEEVKLLLTAQPRTVGSVYGRDLQTETDGVAPSITEQNTSPVKAAGDTVVKHVNIGDTAPRIDAGASQREETEEERDERLAAAQAARLADLARDTHRDLRWTNMGCEPGRPQQPMFARDEAFVALADSINEDRGPKFQTLKDSVADLTRDAVDPRLRIRM